LDIKGAIVTIGAMGCQTDIAAAIIGKKADYILALKNNQKNTFKQAGGLFSRLDNGETELCLDEYTTESAGHGRSEKRITTVIPADSIQNRDRWTNLQTVVRCRYISNAQGKETIAGRYFLSSAQPNARRIGSATRWHWGIENQLHWALDVIFDEDASRAKKGNSPINMNILRKIALTILTEVKPNKRTGFQKMMFRAAMENQYLETVLFRK
jgi:predicted transposase YbfD/YdcC